MTKSRNNSLCLSSQHQPHSLWAYVLGMGFSSGVCADSMYMYMYKEARCTQLDTNKYLVSVQCCCHIMINRIPINYDRNSFQSLNKKQYRSMQLECSGCTQLFGWLSAASKLLGRLCQKLLTEIAVKLAMNGRVVLCIQLDS